jgi:RNA polymerase sigma factor (TIGR02999 family)
MSEDLTQILRAAQAGDARAADRLAVAVYEELRRLAARKLAHEPPGLTLQATALVHEAYLRLVGDEQADWRNRAHFFAAAAEAMRRILVERARRHARQKHGGGRRRVELDEAAPAVPPVPVDLLALDEALARLAALDPVKAELVKLRFFAGLEVADAAKVLQISKATADRYWAYARAWLFDAISHEA